MRGSIVAFAVLGWSGLALLLSTSRGARPVGDERIARYLPGAHLGGSTSARSGSSITDLGDRVARLVGVDGGLQARLVRIHHPLDAIAVRRRQAAVAALATATTVAAATLLLPGLGVATAVAVATPMAAIWIQEHRLTRAATTWQRRIVLELPAAIEHLGLYLGSGLSLGASLQRLAQRGEGVVATDLRRVCLRIRQGLDEHRALAEWARIVEVPAVDRLIKVLALDRETGDLSRLIAEEARSVRLDVHRELLSEARRRAQQVWIPVTVAALVPGAIVLAVPFLHAIDTYAGR